MARRSLAIIAAAAFVLAAFVLAAGVEPAAAAPSITLVVDAREAPRNILHVDEIVPVKPGASTLEYPKWVPGEHGPTGPIHNMAALRISAGGRAISWQRDFVDLYAFRINVPAGVNAVDVSFDQLMTSDDVMATPNLLIINWNRVLLYPYPSKSDNIDVSPSIILPDGWDFGTALPGPQRTGNRVDFAQTTLTQLVDSPLDAGRYFKRIVLLNTPEYSNEIDVVADEPASLELGAATIAHYKNLVAEADALYGYRHWYHYHFLLTLSDAIGFQGIEHHQSSDNRAVADYFTNPEVFKEGADLLPHEFSHSWNGKYRRPYDLYTTDYQVPEKTDLLWVYEGLNQYLGDLLSFRCGLISPKEYPEYLASVYAEMDNEPGRLADPLVDTAIAAPYLYEAPREWSSQRRTAGDFYAEGELVWLAADTIIRTQSHGKKSLDDFLKAFHGQRNTGPMVVTYTRSDVIRALNAVQPYDWSGFIGRYVYSVSPHPPSDSITLGGYKLVWNATPNEFIKLGDEVRHRGSFKYTLGFNAGEDGHVVDVLLGSPAEKAGIGANVTIVAVNGVKFNLERLHAAVKAAQPAAQPIQLLVQQGDDFRTYSLDYHGGERYPHLQRVPGTADLLGQIMAPHRR